ncbi:MAG: glutathione peroxidase [Bdellovibrionales bacterium]|jgi:glutathione peroxidase|nr:glutathione peroxidase [Bdellovibrionales bacterium]
MSHDPLDLEKYSWQTLQGKPIRFDEWKGKVVLVVNVASQCGFTPQYEGLQKLYDTYKDRGFTILGFPCNQFGFQEPGDADQIQSFCSATYQVDFPILAKVNVNGDDAHPFYKDLKKAAPGLLGTEAVKWNFTKFLINREGQVVERFAPRTEPSEIVQEIEKLL